MNTLVALGTISAFIYSTVVTVINFFPELITKVKIEQVIYFDTLAIIITPDFRTFPWILPPLIEI
jgi:cation transport ATPase